MNQNHLSALRQTSYILLWVWMHWVAFWSLALVCSCHMCGKINHYHLSLTVNQQRATTVKLINMKSSSGIPKGCWHDHLFFDSIVSSPCKHHLLSDSLLAPFESDTYQKKVNGCCLQVENKMGPEMQTPSPSLTAVSVVYKCFWSGIRGCCEVDLHQRKCNCCDYESCSLCLIINVCDLHWIMGMLEDNSRS